MNNRRRKQTKNQIVALKLIQHRIDEFNDELMKDEFEDLVSEFESIKDELEWLKDEEQEAYDNIPENLQSSYNASLMEDNVSYYEEAINILETLIESLSEEDTMKIQLISMIEDTISTLYSIDL